MCVWSKRDAFQYTEMMMCVYFNIRYKKGVNNDPHRWHHTYSFHVIGLQVDDVIFWEGPPRFTEQIPITINTLGRDVKKRKGTNVNQMNVTSETKHKPIKFESTTAVSGARLWHLLSNSVGCISPKPWLHTQSAIRLFIIRRAAAAPVCCSCWKVFPCSSFPLWNHGRIKLSAKHCFSNCCCPAMFTSGTNATTR